MLVPRPRLIDERTPTRVTPNEDPMGTQERSVRDWQHITICPGRVTHRNWPLANEICRLHLRRRLRKANTANRAR